MNQVSVFISHNHKDSQYINDIQSIIDNPNNKLSFINISLSTPIFNKFGDISRKPPSHPLSNPVRDAINKLLSDADKLLVLVGNETHSKEWVSWEIESFVSKKGWGEVMLIRTPNNDRGGSPEIAKHLELYDWDICKLKKWVSN